MRITIMRHGKPDFEWQRRVKGADIRHLEREYDAAGIIDAPPAAASGLVHEHACVVCSDLPRSVQSAEALGVDKIDVSSPVFREMNLPYFDNAPITLPLKLWAPLLRSLWFMGFSKNTESFTVAKARAGQAAGQLIELAGRHHSVLFVGHGFLNHYVAKALLKRGWSGPGSPGKKYWESGTYEFN